MMKRSRNGQLDRVQSGKTVLQCLLHMPRVAFALGTAQSTAQVQNLGINWGMYAANIVIQNLGVSA